MQTRWLIAGLAATALLAGCGGGSDGDSVLTRGRLLERPESLGTLSAAQIDGQAIASGLSALAGTARCDVRVLGINYATAGVQGERTNASGVMLVPAGACASDAAALLAYARGTEVNKARTLASLNDGETFLLAAMYAAQGYAVVATDYLGLGRSSHGFHPYLHADSEATSVVDAIRAARQVARDQGTPLSGKVMVTGYSQGGHASAATQRALERDHAQEIQLAGAAHLSAPVNLSGSFQLPDAIAGYQFFVPYIVTSWQKVYGNIYASATDVFRAPYASGIDNLLPSSTLTYTTLVTSGALPGGSPNEARAALFQPAFLADVQNNPSNALIVAARRNDLVDFTPQTRTLLCGGSGDPTVPLAVHQAVYKAALDARGATQVSAVDVDPQVQAAFGPGGAAPTDPSAPEFATYYGSYHGSYVPPFCHARARALFDTLR